MVRLAIVILLVALAAGAFSTDDITMGELPEDVREQLKYLLKNPFPDLKADCTEIPNPKVDYFLYTQSNPDEPIHLDPENPKEVDPRRKVVLVVHGWISNSTDSDFRKLKDEYIKRYNVHLIAVDWSKSAWQLYTSAFCDVPYVGKQIGDFLCYLNKELNLRLYMVHVIGHGLGAQVAGYVGQTLINGECKQTIGRITGLDPAGHLYKKLKESERLDPSDGEQVDVIHTDGMGLGYGPTCGDIDFHPNCGFPQPGCPSLIGLDDNTPVVNATCSTLRSVKLMTESVATEDFVGVSCGRCPTYCSPDIITEVYAIMGENYKPVAPPAHKYLNFFLPTNSTSPYAKGWDPYKIHVDRTILCKNPDKSPILKKVCNAH